MKIAIKMHRILMKVMHKDGDTKNGSTGHHKGLDWTII